MTIMRMLMRFDVQFTTAVFDADEEMYRSLYKSYLDKWQDALRQIDNRHFTIVEPNRTYFADCFAPQEMER